MQYLFFVSMIFSSLFLTSCKTKVSEEQWRGYTQCINRLDKRFDQYFGIVKCRKKFDIPMKKIQCKYNDTSECLAEPFGYKYDF